MIILLTNLVLGNSSGRHIVSGNKGRKGLELNPKLCCGNEGKEFIDGISGNEEELNDENRFIEGWGKR